MNKGYLYIVFLLISIILINACSTKKNTALRRTYHNITAHYNAFFNGREAFKDGMRTLDKSQKDDFTKMLPLFIYENNSNLGSISGKMDRAIEKASKVIKKHSITAKPKRKKGKLTESEKEFYAKKEFNNWVDDSYLMMGKAYVYKKDYASARTNFNFIVSQFPNNPIKYEALIWITRLDLLEKKYKNAIENLERLDGEKNLPKKLEEDLATTYADYYIKKEKYKDAVPWLINSINTEKKKKYRVRYKYILAQVYQHENDFKKASEMYRQVIKMNPPYEMAFNAKINRATSYDNNSGRGKEITKQLQKMLKDDKNIDYQDQIYFAIGNIALKDGNKPEAIKNFKLSAETSVSNNAQKAISFLNLGRLYFERPDYPNSQAYYDSCMSFLPKDYPGYEELSAKTIILNELITNLNEVSKQDSLQKVAAMSPKERNKLIDGIIQKLKEEEARKRAEEQQRIMDNMMFGQNNGGNINNQSQAGKWYFYNTTSLSMGKSEFIRKWGNRKLEDNWRRKDKTSVSFEEIAEDDQTEIDSSTINTFDPKSREYYMHDLPLTDSLLEVSHNKIKAGLFNAGKVYKDKLNDFPKAIESFEELNRRYPKNENELEAWYYSYQAAMLNKDDPKKEHYKNLIVSEYPNSNFAKILTNPDYLAELEAENHKIYNLYDRAYQEFRRRNYSKTIEFANYADSVFTENPLVSKFKLLKALSIGGTGNVDELKAELTSIVNDYPNSDEKATADYILSRVTAENYTNFIPQGQTSSYVTDNANTPIDSATTTTPDEIIAQEFYKYNKDAKHYYVVAIENNDIDINRIKFDITSYNVENFLMFDFEAKKIPFNKNIQFVIVKTLKNRRQASKYFKIITKRSDVFTSLRPMDYQQFIISKENFEKLRDDKDIEKYLRFYRKNYN